MHDAGQAEVPTAVLEQKSEEQELPAGSPVFLAQWLEDGKTVAGLESSFPDWREQLKTPCKKPRRN